MAEQIMIAAASVFLTAAITTAVNEWRHRSGQREKRICEIVDKFLELRRKGMHERVYELRALQCSGLLLLEEEKDADEVLRRIEVTDRRIELPGFIGKDGVLKGLRTASGRGIDIGDFREVAIEEIRQATS